MEVLLNLPKKTINHEELPFQNSLAKKFDDIFKKDKVITPQYCFALQEKREAKKKKQAKLKKEQAKQEKLNGKIK